MPEPANVLLVDDDSSITRLLAARLHADGYETRIATDGRTGIRIASDTHPDAILLDYRMDGMDGLQVLDALSAQPDTRDIPVVMLSANINSMQRDRALELGASYILQKPYDPKTVLETVATAIRAGRPMTPDPRVAAAAQEEQ